MLRSSINALTEVITLNFYKKNVQIQRNTVGFEGNACENFRRNGTFNNFLHRKLNETNLYHLKENPLRYFPIANRYHIPSTEHSSRSIMKQGEHSPFGISDLKEERGRENENSITSEIVLLFLKKKNITTHTSVVPLFIQNKRARVTCYRRTFFFSRD